MAEGLAIATDSNSAVENLVKRGVNIVSFFMVGFSL